MSQWINSLFIFVNCNSCIHKNCEKITYSFSLWFFLQRNNNICLTLKSWYQKTSKLSGKTNITIRVSMSSHVSASVHVFASISSWLAPIQVFAFSPFGKDLSLNPGEIVFANNTSVIAFWHKYKRITGCCFKVPRKINRHCCRLSRCLTHSGFFLGNLSKISNIIYI